MAKQLFCLVGVIEGRGSGRKEHMHPEPTQALNIRQATLQFAKRLRSEWGEEVYLGNCEVLLYSRCRLPHRKPKTQGGEEDARIKPRLEQDVQLLLWNESNVP